MHTNKKPGLKGLESLDPDWLYKSGPSIMKLYPLKVKIDLFFVPVRTPGRVVAPARTPGRVAPDPPGC
jgi:hypothetical protein